MFHAFILKLQMHYSRVYGKLDLSIGYYVLKINGGQFLSTDSSPIETTSSNLMRFAI